MEALHIRKILLVLTTFYMLTPTMTLYRLSNFTIEDIWSSGQPVPECKYTVLNNSQLHGELFLEPYQGTLYLECSATDPLQTITNETFQHLAQYAMQRNLTLSLYYLCKYKGVIDYIFLNDIRNLVYFQLVECIVDAINVSAKVYEPENDNLIYYGQYKCVRFATVESSKNILMYKSSMPCDYGKNVVYVLRTDLTQQEMESLGLPYNAVMDKYINNLQYMAAGLMGINTTNTELGPELRRNMYTHGKTAKCPKLLKFSYTDSIKSVQHSELLIYIILDIAPNLQILNLSGNGFVSIPTAVQAKIASSVSLKVVDLSRNNITQVSFNPEMIQLYEKIIIGYNQIRLVILSDCQIKTIRLHNLKEIVRYKFLYLDLSNNPIHCDCDLKPALEYMYKNNEYFNTSYYKYLWDIECVEPAPLNGVTLSEVQVNKLCLNSQKLIIKLLPVVLTLSAFLVMVVLLSICLYRHRVTVKALVHNYIVIKCCPRKYVHYQDQNGVFIVFSSDDSAIANDLIERLETNVPLIKVQSVHDMMADAPWLTELDGMVRTSTYTVMLLSRNFLEDPECMTVFKMAYEQSINERRQSLIAVLLCTHEDLGEVQDERLKLFLRFNTYLVHNQRWFWDNLVYALLRNPRNAVFDHVDIEQVNVDEHEL